MNAAPSDPQQGPLSGVTIVDLSTVVSGPLCSQILGDLGAEVVKVESPRGDITRMMGPPFRAGMTGLFAQVNRNKRSIVIDMKNEQGLEVIRRLIAKSDVLVENFRPRVSDRLGIGYQWLATENPGLIYVAISGFGREGPYSDLPAYDNVIQGLGGFTHVQGSADHPELVRSIVADKASGLTAAYATMAALFARERNGGTGQLVDVPMLDSFAAFMLADVIGAETFISKDESQQPFDMSSVHRAWQTSDGHVVMMVVEDTQFEAICRVLEREDLIDDPRCVDLVTRLAHGPELFSILANELKKRTTTEVVERSRRLGAPLAPANSIGEFLSDPQVQSSNIMWRTEDTVIGPMQLLGNPVRFHSTPTSLRRRPPQLGEHSDEILNEIGYDAEQISRLRADAAVA